MHKKNMERSEIMTNRHYINLINMKIVFVEIGLFTFANHTRQLFAKSIEAYTKKEKKKRAYL